MYSFCLCPGRQWPAPRGCHPETLFPGPGLAVGRAVGETTEEEALMQRPQGTYSPAGSQSQFAPWRRLEAGAGSVW